MPLNGLVIVDNERLVADLLKLTFEASGCPVSIMEAIESAGHMVGYESELFLINPEIPGALQFLKTHGRAYSILALTGSPELAQEARDAGVEVIDPHQKLADLVEAVRERLNIEVLPSRSGEHILIVDDDGEVRKTVAEFLASSGYRVSTASSGQQALEAVDSDTSIAVILLDVNMPGTGGLETLAELKKRKKNESVIMLSGIADQQVAGRAIAFGAFDYILKPPDFHRVESAVSACIGHAEYKRQRFWS